MTHPGIYKTVVVVTGRFEDLSQTFTFSGELPSEEAAQRAMFSMRYADVLRIDDIYVTYVKDMTKLSKPVLGWGS